MGEVAKWRAGDADDDDDGGVVGSVGVHASGCAARCVPGLISRPPRYQKEKKKNRQQLHTIPKFMTIVYFRQCKSLGHSQLYICNSGKAKIVDSCTFPQLEKTESLTVVHFQYTEAH